MQVTTADLERLGRLIASQSGIEFPAVRWPFLRSRVHHVMRQNGFTDGDEWATAVETSASTDGTLYRALEAAVLVHETSFLRYPAHHRWLAALGPEELVTRSTCPAPFRIWSVGCATGQEPYSIAMTFLDRLGPCPAIEIVAVDLSREALVVAESGTYPVAAAALLPPAWRSRYLEPSGNDVTVRPEVRRLVRFLPYDIRDGIYLGRFDLVFCCNVLLYFTPTLRGVVVRRLGEALHRSGYLVLGHADGIVPPADVFEPRLAEGFIYRRR